MTSKISIYDFLEVIVEDNFTYNFPIHEIRLEVVNLMMSQDEFIYFMQQAHKKIEQTHGKITADIFTTIVHKEFDLNNNNQSTLYNTYLVLFQTSYITKYENLSNKRIPIQNN